MRVWQEIFGIGAVIKSDENAERPAKGGVKASLPKQEMVRGGRAIGGAFIIYSVLII